MVFGLKGRKGPIDRLARLSRRPKLPLVVEPRELERMFQRERLRVDRTDRVFSLVVFLPSQGEDRPLDRMTRALYPRLRASDIAGELDQRHLAVLMPETDGKSAWVFADDAVRILSEAGFSYNCAVYSYPTDWGELPGPGGVDGPLRRSLDHEAEQGPAEAPMDAKMDDGPARQVEGLDGLLTRGLPWWKRLIDVVAAGLILLALLPFFLMVSIAIKLTSRGPVFFSQERVGIGGRKFQFHKFRSMHIDAEQRKDALRAMNEAAGPMFKIRNDPRFTPIGSFLRRSSIDELPQLYNVLRGDMTLVGPRPPTPDEVPDYEPWQRRRLDVTGGLTCIWQVSGRSEVGFVDMVRMDLTYQRRSSLVMDLRLLWRTVFAVLSGRGAY